MFQKFQNIFFVLLYIQSAKKSSSLNTFDNYDLDYDGLVEWNEYKFEEYEDESQEMKFDNHLNLTDVYIPILNDKIFDQDDYKNLSEIILNNNKIQHIDVHTFDKFNKTLKHLQLTSNNLSTFDIQPIKSLKVLNLSNNSLTILNSTKFQNLSLNHLDVSSNNLTVVYCFNVATSIILSHNNISNICNFTKSMKRINLSYNNIKYIHNYTFKHLRGLEHLILSHNQIVTLQYDTFDYSLYDLSLINLSHNMINELDLLQFKDLRNIQTLDLSYNNISTVKEYSNLKLPSDLNSFGYFRHLYLEGNLIRKINMTNLSNICSRLSVISISFSEISCSMLQHYISVFRFKFLKGPVINEENINGIKCDSSLNTLKDSDAIDSMLILLNKINAILIVLAFFFVVFVIVSIIVTVKRFRANLTLK